MVFSVVGPVIIQSLINQSVVELESAVFNCTASGLPRPNITWTILQNGIELIFPIGTADFSTSMIRGTDDRQFTSILTVTSARPALAATYVCTASNIVSNDTAGATLVVYSEFKLLNQLYCC